MFNAVRALRAAFLAFCILGLVGQAHANDHGGGGGGASDIVTLEPITTNLAAEVGREGRFIQVAISLRLNDAQAAVAVNAYMPQIRHDILMVLCTHTGASLQDPTGREALVDEIKDAANAVVGTPAKTNKQGRRIAAEGPVKHVLFTSFIIQ